MSIPRKLYRFEWYMRRSANIVGIFTATEEEIEKALGREAHLGEVAGKHSDVYGTLTHADFTVLTDDEAFIAQAEAIKLIPVGINPLKYLVEYCEHCGESLFGGEDCYCRDDK